MALDPTAREANVRDSLRRFFIDNLSTTEKIPLAFDTALSRPKIQGTPSEIDRWVNVNFGQMIRDDLSDYNIQVICSVRKDKEGFRLAQLTDTVMGHLTDITANDGARRITFYKSSANIADWTVIGGLLVSDIIESEQIKAEDETKFIILNVTIRFASKI